MGIATVLFAYKVYRRTFRVPVRTSRGLWETREGILLRIEQADGRVGYGEVAPLESFGSETLAGALSWCASLGTRVEPERVRAVPRALPGCSAAVASALRAEEADTPEADSKARRLSVCGLLPAGPAAATLLQRLAADGFATFKIKIGTTDFATERAMIERLCDQLPKGGRLRLDANGGLDIRNAMRWLDAAEGWPVEFIEQPLATEARHELVTLAHDHNVALALDEAVRDGDDIKRWRDLGWPGVFVLKPGIAGDPSGWMPEVTIAPDAFVFSSALETAVGTTFGLRLAFASGTERALGYGVSGFFEADGMGGGLDRCAIAEDEVGEIYLEAVWNAL